MKVTALETIHLAEYPRALWVRVHTDEGLVGLGETFFSPEVAAAVIHTAGAAALLGRDPLAVERHSRALGRGSGIFTAELSAASAIDLALWDLFGQATNLPVYRLLGGPTRERVRVYNTCAGYRYGRGTPRGAAATYYDDRTEGPYEDLRAFMTDAGKLAESLLDEGVTAMKIWPFDQFGPETGGQWITEEQIDKGLQPFRQIRDAVGMRMDVALEMHSVWNLPSAIRIAKAVEPYRPMWFEDPVRMTDLDAVAQFRAATPVPTTASETLATRWAFRELLERHAVSVVMFDLGWVGGLTEAKKIAAMAEAHQLPVAPHDCTGPVVFMASAHLDFAISNCMIQEMVRAYVHGWYPQVVTALPPIERGYLLPPPGPGLGIQLRPEVTERPDATVRVTRAT